MAKEDKRESGKEVLRLFRLDALLQTDKYFSKEQLADLLDVSIPTVDRDIKRLREDWHAPLEWDRDNGGYHYTSQFFKLPHVFVTEEEMPAYAMARKLYKMFQGTPLYEPLLKVFQSFENPVESEMNYRGNVKFKTAKPTEHKAWFETRIVMGTRHVAAVGNEEWDIILEALKNNWVLEFDYANVTSDKKTKSRTIEPWQLIYDNEQWYLRGLASQDGKSVRKSIRNFVVPRMQNLKLLPTHFSLPEEKIWQLDTFAVGYFGALATEQIETYKFIFQGTALYYSEAEFAYTKTVEPYTGDIPHKEGAVLVSFRSNQPIGIKRQFFPYGEDIIPLEPKWFVEEWKDTVRGMTKYL